MRVRGRRPLARPATGQRHPTHRGLDDSLLLELPHVPYPYRSVIAASKRAAPAHARGEVRSGGGVVSARWSWVRGLPAAAIPCRPPAATAHPIPPPPHPRNRPPTPPPAPPLARALVCGMPLPPCAAADVALGVLHVSDVHVTPHKLPLRAQVLPIDCVCVLRMECARVLGPGSFRRSCHQPSPSTHTLTHTSQPASPPAHLLLGVPRVHLGLGRAGDHQKGIAGRAPAHLLRMCAWCVCVCVLRGGGK